MPAPISNPTPPGNNFSQLTMGQKTTWARDLMKEARKQSLMMQFAGSGHNAIIQRITELTKSAKGTRAIITLLNNLTGMGKPGDTRLEDNEEKLKARDIEVFIDQLRHANRIEGRMADQKTIVAFRSASKDVLAYWLADMIDRMGFLTLSGIPYRQSVAGKDEYLVAATAGEALTDLVFAKTVTLPSERRHVLMDVNGITNGASNIGATANTNGVAASLTTNHKLSYKGLVHLKAYAKDEGIRGVRTKAGDQVYHMFVSPQGMAQLKLDSDFMAAARNAQARNDSNVIWSGGTSMMVDGIMIHETEYCFDSRYADTVPDANQTDAGTAANISGGSTNGYPVSGLADMAALEAAGTVPVLTKAGSAGTTNWQRSLFLGAQAMGLADLGAPYWDEDKFDYNNQLGIATGKILGFVKPTFYSTRSSTVEDYGVIAVDTALDI